MNRKDAEEIMARAKVLHDAGRHEEAQELIRASMREAKAQGATVDIEDFDTIANFAQRAVEVALDEIIAVAHRLGATEVPVAVLEELKKHQCTAVRAMYSTMESLEVPLSVSVPDDLSELEGL
jgi:hypothetical protein